MLLYSDVRRKHAVATDQPPMENPITGDITVVGTMHCQPVIPDQNVACAPVMAIEELGLCTLPVEIANDAIAGVLVHSRQVAAPLGC